MADERLGGEQRALQMRVDHRVPGGLRVVLERAVLVSCRGGRRTHAGVVHQDGGGAKARRDARERRLDIAFLCEVHQFGVDAVPGGGQRGKPVGRAGHVDRRDVGAGLGEGANVLGAQAAKATGDDGDLA